MSRAQIRETKRKVVNSTALARDTGGGCERRPERGRATGWGIRYMDGENPRPLATHADGMDDLRPPPPEKDQLAKLVSHGV